MLAVWVTETKLVLDYVDIDEQLYERMHVGQNSWRLGRFIPDMGYAASKKAQFTPLLSGGEMRTISERGEPLYLWTVPDWTNLFDEIGSCVSKKPIFCHRGSCQFIA